MQEVIFVLIKIIEKVLKRSLNEWSILRMNLFQPPIGMQGSLGTKAQHGLDIFADPDGSDLIACYFEGIDDGRAVGQHVGQAFGGFL